MNKMVSLRNPDNLLIQEETGALSYGCNQDWFGTEWQRRAGCGPSTASNLFLYMHRTGRIVLPFGADDKDGCIRLMESVWNHVTPTPHGVYLTEIFFNGVHTFSEENGYTLQCSCQNVPEETELRAPWLDVLAFISDGLQKDCPVAFLNLCNGKVENLDRWHWVTIVSLEPDENTGVIFAHIYDGTRDALIDLKLWYETTTMGGGFVYFEN